MGSVPVPQPLSHPRASSASRPPLVRTVSGYVRSQSRQSHRTRKQSVPPADAPQNNHQYTVQHAGMFPHRRTDPRTDRPSSPSVSPPTTQVVVVRVVNGSERTPDPTAPLTRTSATTLPMRQQARTVVGHDQRAGPHTRAHAIHIIHSSYPAHLSQPVEISIVPSQITSSAIPSPEREVEGATADDAGSDCQIVGTPNEQLEQCTSGDNVASTAFSLPRERTMLPGHVQSTATAEPSAVPSSAMSHRDHQYNRVPRQTIVSYEGPVHGTLYWSHYGDRLLPTIVHAPVPAPAHMPRPNHSAHAHPSPAACRAQSPARRCHQHSHACLYQHRVVRYEPGVHSYPQPQRPSFDPRWPSPVRPRPTMHSFPLAYHSHRGTPIALPPLPSLSQLPTGKPHGRGFSDEKHRERPASKAIVKDPLLVDVLCGRGAAVNSHEGNLRYRRMVSEMREKYTNGEDELSKMDMAKLIVARIEAEGGRFLRFDKEEKVYVAVSKAEAWKKTHQAMREVWKIRW